MADALVDPLADALVDILLYATLIFLLQEPGFDSESHASGPLNVAVGFGIQRFSTTSIVPGKYAEVDLSTFAVDLRVRYAFDHQETESTFLDLRYRPMWGGADVFGDDETLPGLRRSITAGYSTGSDISAGIGKAWGHFWLAGGLWYQSWQVEEYQNTDSTLRMLGLPFRWLSSDRRARGLTSFDIRSVGPYLEVGITGQPANPAGTGLTMRYVPWLVYHFREGSRESQALSFEFRLMRGRSGEGFFGFSFEFGGIFSRGGAMRGTTWASLNFHIGF